jgi:hypothetical protein
MSSRSILPLIRRAALGLAVVLVLPGAGPVETGNEEGLTLELNKVEEVEEGCQTFFLLDNDSGHVFDGFRLELILFDQKGVIADRLRVDLAPVRRDKRTVSTYVFPGTPCAEIGSILVNDIPICEARDGTALDCLDLLKVGHRDAIALEK